jgi:hypothetical protein
MGGPSPVPLSSPEGSMTSNMSGKFPPSMQPPSSGGGDAMGGGYDPLAALMAPPTMRSLRPQTSSSSLATSVSESSGDPLGSLMGPPPMRSFPSSANSTPPMSGTPLTIEGNSTVPPATVAGTAAPPSGKPKYNMWKPKPQENSGYSTSINELQSTMNNFQAQIQPTQPQEQPQLSQARQQLQTVDLSPVSTISDMSDYQHHPQQSSMSQQNYQNYQNYYQGDPSAVNYAGIAAAPEGSGAETGFEQINLDDNANSYNLQQNPTNPYENYDSLDHFS